MADITGVRKAAILLLSLDEAGAAEILKRLGPEQVEEVSREIASIAEIPVTTRKDIFKEFYSLALANSYVSEGGLEYAKTLLRKSLSEADATWRGERGGRTVVCPRATSVKETRASLQRIGTASRRRSARK